MKIVSNSKITKTWINGIPSTYSQRRISKQSVSIAARYNTVGDLTESGSCHKESQQLEARQPLQTNHMLAVHVLQYVYQVEMLSVTRR